MSAFGKWRTNLYAQLSISMTLAIFLLTLSNQLREINSCKSTEFQCNITHNCIPLSYLCDGDNDCDDDDDDEEDGNDLSDEANCESCSIVQFKCNITRKCIPLQFQCNRKHDCEAEDKSDEENCENCSRIQFQCIKTKRCIPNGHKCDGDYDCGEDDRSDELNCESCSRNSFLCNNTKQCMHRRFVCDGDNDCGDLSDEESCTNITGSISRCTANEFQCETKKQHCLPNSVICDGTDHCGDFSDERNCSTGVCRADQFACLHTKRCISRNYICDGDDDCRDMSDETNCTVNRDEFECHATNKTIPNAYKCDGDNDCGDLSDELNCDYGTTQCPKGRHKCRGEYCLKYRRFCDGQNDCLDNSDENECINKGDCNGNEHRCKNGKCVSDKLVCNGNHDCSDESDEIYCDALSCTGFWCGSSMKCVPSTNKCDLKYDCEDTTDETDCPAQVKLLPVLQRITGTISNKARWDFTIASNVDNWTIIWKNPLDHHIYFNTGKYSISLIKINKLLYNMSLEVSDITWADKGYYPLQVFVGNINEEAKTFFLNLAVEDFSAPTLMHTNLMNSTLTFTSGIPLELVCNVTGRPRTKLSWFLDDLVSQDWPRSIKYTIFRDEQALLLQEVPSQFKGRFICKATNMNGEISAYTDIVVIHTVDMLVLIMGPIGGILGMLVLFFGGLILRYQWKQRKLRIVLSSINEKEFYQGAIENLNPDLSVTDQAHLLPFQQAMWELPRQNIKLGIPLGSGAFGLVLKARALGIAESEEFFTVAVKTVKASADESHFKALITELKIMANLGKHMNIVNLMGACTKDLAKKRELLVVMEYCKHGSLLSYMLKKRDSFINQLNSISDSIDQSISMQKMGNSSTLQRQEDSTGTMMETSTDFQSYDYKGDYQSTDTEAVKSSDLLSWAFQVAKGMEYLSIRKVLHGDLAARNVLLTENNIAKICDFGYARETFKNYDYKKNTKGILLPIKWMAIESIYCGVFSSKSDCWSYGVLMWEMFTMGNKPYPGMEVNEDFCQRLHDGYRMDKPKYAPTSIYQVMLDCWAHEPSDRPSFSQVSIRLREMISNWDRNGYMKLSEIYTNLPEDRMQSGTDYLMKMTKPGFCADTSGNTERTTVTSKRYQEVPSSPTRLEPTCSILVGKGDNDNRCTFVTKGIYMSDERV